MQCTCACVYICTCMCNLIHVMYMYLVHVLMYRLLKRKKLLCWLYVANPCSEYPDPSAPVSPFIAIVVVVNVYPVHAPTEVSRLVVQTNGS